MELHIPKYRLTVGKRVFEIRGLSFADIAMLLRDDEDVLGTIERGLPSLDLDSFLYWFVLKYPELVDRILIVASGGKLRRRYLMPDAQIEVLVSIFAATMKRDDYLDLPEAEVEDTHDFPRPRAWMKEIHRRVSFLVSQGHRDAAHYPLGMLSDEYELAAETSNLRLAQEASLLQLAMGSVHIKKAGPMFRAAIKALTDGK